MKGSRQRVLIFIMIATMASWSQAEICPMKLQSQRPEACGSTMPMAQHHATPARARQHDCCPKEKQRAATKAQCPDHQLSACESAMACCSLDVPLSATAKAHSPSAPAVSNPDNAIFPLPIRTPRIVSEQSVSSENSVFRLKEDLRI